MARFTQLLPVAAVHGKLQLGSASRDQFPRDYWAYNWLPDSNRQLKEKAVAQAEGRNADSE